jgi:peptide/nickel transport system permease protein
MTSETIPAQFAPPGPPVPARSRARAVAGAIPWRRVVTRAFSGVLVLWAASTVAFFTLQAVPGNIVDILAGEQTYPGLKAAITAEWGLDKPVLLQYLQFLGRLLHGDLGESYVQRQPVADILGRQVGSTIELALLAGILGALLAVTLAVVSLGRGRAVRSAMSTVELIFTSVPTFWVGILLLMVFSFTLHLFPVAGANGLQSLVLPVITLALPTAGFLAQVIRESMERTLTEPFIVTVRARGVSESLVLLRHALKHALLPVMTLLGGVIGGLLGGAVITETVFGRPGIGTITLNAVTSKDIPVVLAVVLFAALIYVVVSTVLDILYTIVDPRLRAAR